MYEALKIHLLPGDGLESVAIALCGIHHSNNSTKVLVHRVIPIPVDDCILRTDVQVTWKTDKLIEILELVSMVGFGAKETSEKMSFEITNLHLNGDTLVGNLENELLRLTGKLVKLSIVRSGSGSVVGIGNDLELKNGDDNPLFVSSNTDFHFFKCMDKESVKNQERAFFEKQEKNLNAELEIETDETKKQIIKNSLVEITSRLGNK